RVPGSVLLLHHRATDTYALSPHDALPIFIVADLLLALYARFYTHDGSELNRQTGTLTIARRFRKPFVAPFYEFDPVMQLLPTGYIGREYVRTPVTRKDRTQVCASHKIHTL